MPHEIGKMFWYGEVPWHGLGREVDRPATVDEALCAGGLDWEAKLVPLATDEAPSSPASQRMAVTRSDRQPGDPGRVIGVVHRGFRPLQNREGATLVDHLFEPGGRKFHTGGYLRNGEIVWLLARLPQQILVYEDDVVEPYLLYSNSHDGSRAIDLRFTTVRVVCRNTLSFALSWRSLRVFRRAHKNSPKALERDAAEFMKRTIDQIRYTQEQMVALAARPCDDTTFARFLRTLLPNPSVPSLPASREALRSYERRRDAAEAARRAILAIRQNGLPDKQIPPERPTWWGSVNAITAWVDHVQPIAGARLAHALFGPGDKLKTLGYQRAIWAARIAANVAKDSTETSDVRVA